MLSTQYDHFHTEKSKGKMLLAWENIGGDEINFNLASK
jgi:hypothetical protein